MVSRWAAAVGLAAALGAGCVSEDMELALEAFCARAADAGAGDACVCEPRPAKRVPRCCINVGFACDGDGQCCAETVCGPAPDGGGTRRCAAP